MNKEIKTIRGYDFFEVSSAMQKAIRRGDAESAGYWALELFESNYHNYVWKRLFTTSAEDVWGLITEELRALKYGFDLVNTNRRKGEKANGRIFISKAVILLSLAKKSRDADHLNNLVYDKDILDGDEIIRQLEDARKDPAHREIPPYAYDVHTRQGKRMGKTKSEFFRVEHEALTPRVPGLFDSLVED